MIDFDRSQDRWNPLKKEVSDAIYDIYRDVGVDFRKCLRTLM